MSRDESGTGWLTVSIWAQCGHEALLILARQRKWALASFDIHLVFTRTCGEMFVAVQMQKKQKKKPAYPDGALTNVTNKCSEVHP